MSKDKLKRYNLWISEESFNKLKELQKTEGIALSTFIRIAIKEKLDKYIEKKK